MNKNLKHYKKNILLLLLGKIIFTLSIGWSIINIIYFKKIDISYNNIGLIFAFETILILIAAIPLAYYSDNYNRKNTIIIASITTFLSTIFLILFNNLYGAIIWAFFSGISYAATAGPFEAMLYENLKRLKRRHYFSDIYSHIHVLVILAGSASAFIYPLLLEKNILYPMYISSLLSLISLFIFSLLFFKPNKKSKNIKINHKYELFKQNMIALRKIKNIKILLWVVLFESIWLSGLWSYEEFLIQPFIEGNYSMKDYGIIFGTSMILQALLVKVFSLLLKKINTKIVFLSTIVITFVFTLFHTLFPKDIFIIILSISIILGTKNYVLILISDITNKVITKDFIRNTVFAIASTIATIVYAVYITIIGFSVDKLGVDNTLSYNNYFLLFVGIILIVYLFIILKNKSK